MWDKNLESDDQKSSKPGVELKVWEWPEGLNRQSNDYLNLTWLKTNKLLWTRKNFSGTYVLVNCILLSGDDDT